MKVDMEHRVPWMCSLMADFNFSPRNTMAASVLKLKVFMMF